MDKLARAICIAVHLTHLLWVQRVVQPLLKDVKCLLPIHSLIRLEPKLPFDHEFQGFQIENIVIHDQNRRELALAIVLLNILNCLGTTWDIHTSLPPLKDLYIAQVLLIINLQAVGCLLFLVFLS